MAEGRRGGGAEPPPHLVHPGELDGKQPLGVDALLRTERRAACINLDGLERIENMTRAHARMDFGLLTFVTDGSRGWTDFRGWVKLTDSLWSGMQCAPDGPTHKALVRHAVAKDVGVRQRSTRARAHALIHLELGVRHQQNVGIVIRDVGIRSVHR